MKPLRVSVRTLVEHSLRSGDLVQEFSESIHPVEAIRVHQKLQDSRPTGYQKEVHVSHKLATEDFLLEIRGRIDGVLEDAGKTLIEEIKTTQRKPPENNQLHWGQAKIYSYIYAAERDLQAIDIQLTYYSLKSGQVWEFRRQYALDELKGFLEDVSARYLEWQKTIESWVQVRDKCGQKGVFPFSSYRPGQREMAIAIYRTIKANNQILIQAPTGIGKTMAAIFPAVKAITEGLTQKLFYLTARTTGKAAAEKSLLELAKCGIRLKSITLTAKRKICFNPEKECTGDQCSYAQGFYDRLNGAVDDLFQEDLLTRGLIEEIAKTHHVCPFELSLEMALWVDCIVCDYNYVFDPRVNLRRVFQNTVRHHTFVVDETHNLPDRAREMFSSELEKQAFLELKSAFKSVHRLSKSLGKINWHLARLRKQCERNERPNADAIPPRELYPKLKEFHQIAEDLLLGEESRELPNREALLDLYFQVSGFLRVAERYDSNYVTCYQAEGKDLRVKLFCLDPSDHLEEILKESKASIFFSATLTPLDYFKSILGCSKAAHQFQLPSPFPRRNLCLTVADHTSTIFRERDDTKHDVASLLSAFVSQQAGNYLLFFPSYQYLNLVLDCFPPLIHHCQTVIQTPAMTEHDRDRFVARFSEEGLDRLVGFAVMGGIFGEGIDLVGKKLTGAAIVGVGLPALCLERDLIRRHYDQKGFSGFDYAYRFPGINRVLQAAGRVIRSASDLGSVLLIDDRYSRYSYRRLLPNHWELLSVADESELSNQLQRFWSSSQLQSLLSSSQT